MALAHTISNAAEAAYRRGDLLDKRRRLMAEWAKYCDNAKPFGESFPSRAKERDRMQRDKMIDDVLA